MRGRTAIVALFIVAIATGQLMQRQTQSPATTATPRLKVPEGWPKELILPKVVVTETAAALPRASLTEPFEVGEALHDPRRVGDAVVSLLSLMDIGVVADDAPMGATSGAGTLRLTDSEVQALIAMGQVDAEAASANPDSGPFTFADLHRSLSPLLKGISIGQLAEMYANAYETSADSLVPEVLQGRPIEPDTPLLRTQLWLLLADLVAPRSAAPRAAQRRPTWGTGNVLTNPSLLASPDPRFTGVEWRELLVRLPLIVNQGNVTITPQPALAHEGHGGPGAPVPIEVRVSSSARPIVSSLTGRTLLTPAATGLAGASISWQYAGALLSHGTMSVPQMQPMRVPATGVARLSFTPKAEAAMGRGVLQADQGDIEAFVRPVDLLSPLFNVPAPAIGLAWGEQRVVRTAMTVGWHALAPTNTSGQSALDTITVRLYNPYTATIQVGVGMRRSGTDTAEGTLTRGADGSYRGVMELQAIGTMELPGRQCGALGMKAKQLADVIGSPITETVAAGQLQGAFYTAVHRPDHYVWTSGQPFEYLRLEFFPKTAPAYEIRDSCQDEIGAPQQSQAAFFIPLNDARWTVEHTGYPIAIPKAGSLVYEDRTAASIDPWTGAPINRESNKFARALQDLTAGTTSTFFVKVDRLR